MNKAARGIYSKSEVKRGLNLLQLKQHFDSQKNDYVVKPAVQRMINFKQINLMHTPPQYDDFDLIFCRYVLIYMDDEQKQQILAKLVNKLNVGGYLILDPAISLKVRHPKLKNIRFNSQNIFMKV